MHIVQATLLGLLILLVIIVLPVVLVGLCDHYIFNDTLFDALCDDNPFLMWGIFWLCGWAIYAVLGIGYVIGNAILS
jgi:hypothetical protein